MLAGLQFIHQQGVAHRDLSLENMLITADGTLKICDFGLSAFHQPMPDGLTDMVGKLIYMAPEVYVPKHRCCYDGQVSDAWSLGICLFILLAGLPPTERPSNNDPCFKCLKDGPGGVGLRQILQAWDMLERFSSVGLMELLTDLLTVDPAERQSMTVGKCLEQAWVSPPQLSPQHLAEAMHQDSMKRLAGEVAGRRGGAKAGAGTSRSRSLYGRVDDELPGKVKIANMDFRRWLVPNKRNLRFGRKIYRSPQAPLSVRDHGSSTLMSMQTGSLPE